MSGSECGCRRPPFWHTDFDSRLVGVDETAGRFAEVSVERCRSCGQRWLRYFYEAESFSRSGRWYRVPLSDEEAASVTAASAASLMCGRPWHFRGGSYFDTTGVRCDWPIDPNRL